MLALGGGGGGGKFLTTNLLQYGNSPFQGADIQETSLSDATCIFPTSSKKKLNNLYLFHQGAIPIWTGACKIYQSLNS